jgi:hypothetical protein
MSNPTTPFSWQMPTATDLVTDLPADFEVFGQAVATSMADLLGGTTGQVLSKTTNADMDFTWVTTDDTNAIQNSIMDAKGDLIGATAADTPSRLAVGANGTVLTADSAEATGLKWATPATGSAKGVSVYNTVGYTLANNTYTAMTFNSEDFDTDAFHSTVTNTSRLTVPAGLGGKYSIKAQLLFNVNATGFRNIKIYKNGVAVRASVEAIPSGTIYVGLVMSTDLTLVATDYIELFAYQNSGGNLTVYPTLADGQFSMMYWGS